MGAIKLPRDFKLIFKTVAGSRLYGTDTSLSDIDVRGVFIPAPKYFLGCMRRVEQFENKKDDITYFELRKFLQLAADCNPNIIELLFVPTKNWKKGTKEWLEIVSSREAFLSKKARYTFSGYAFSQIRRIKSHRQWLLNPPKEAPYRRDFDLPVDQSLIPKEQIGAFNKLLSMYLEEIRQFHPLKEQLDEMTETRDFLGMIQSIKNVDLSLTKHIMPLSDNLVEALDKEKRYAQALRNWNQYQIWKKNRNPERAKLESKFGFDTKHCMHCFRLISEGEELLETGFITFPRPDREFLLEIKAGKYKYELLEEKLNNVDNIFERLYNKSELPKVPNEELIDNLCIKLLTSFI